MPCRTSIPLVGHDRKSIGNGFEGRLHLQTQQKNLVHIMIWEVGVDVTVKCILWVKTTGLRTALLNPGWDAPGS